MSCSVDKSLISQENMTTIDNLLTIKPEVDKNRYVKNVEIEPIIFYNDKGASVDIPYIFASSLFQFIPNINIKYPIVNLQFKGTLREYQKPVITEAWEQLHKYGTTTLGLHPGWGKTIAGSRLACELKLPTVILVHREILTTQWKKTFQDTSNADIWIVGEKNPPPLANVIICMDTRWQQIPKEFRDKIGTLIIDEAHAFCTPGHVNCLLAFHPKYIIIESASLMRDDGLHSMIYAIAGTHGVFRETNKPFNVIKVMTNTKPIRKLNRMQGVDWTALLRDTLMNQRRNQLIILFVQQNLNQKILILTSLKDHTTLLYEALDKLGIPSDYLCGTKRGYKDSTVLVGTMSKIGTGFDPATSCPTYAGRPFDLLLVVSSIKKYQMLIQNIGRVFRADFPTVMHFVDNDDIFKSHWYKARKWYLTHGGTITDYNIPNTEENVPSSAPSDVQNTWLKNKLSIKQ
jgi:hypothetical protein